MDPVYQANLRFFHLPKRQVTPNPAVGNQVRNHFKTLQCLRRDLNIQKDRFGKIPVPVRRKISYATDFYRHLFKYLIFQHDAQLVTHAWLKMYEMLSWCHSNNLFLLPSTSDCSKLTIFCNAELPGGFIGALNHFVPTILKCEWEWLACSLRSSGLRDSFGISHRYPERWLQNQHMDGDVTKIKNISVIRERVLNKFANGVLLYTSDAGCDVSQDFNAQEEIMSAIHLGQVLLGLLTTRKGETC